MAFQPRIHENGGPCCTAELALCDKCKTHHAWGGARSLRTAAENDFSPPDPYAADLEKLRGEHLDLTPDLDPRHKANPMTPPDSYAIHLNYARAKAGETPPAKTPLDANGIPDPYAAALDKMRKEQR